MGRSWIFILFQHFPNTQYIDAIYSINHIRSTTNCIGINSNKAPIPYTPCIFWQMQSFRPGSAAASMALYKITIFYEHPIVTSFRVKPGRTWKNNIDIIYDIGWDTSTSVFDLFPGNQRQASSWRRIRAFMNPLWNQIDLHGNVAFFSFHTLGKINEDHSSAGYIGMALER